MVLDTVYELSKALPNKWLNPDGSITDAQGNIIEPANEVGAEVYKSSKSIINKFVDIDGETKTYAEISLDIFEPVSELPKTGDKNKIYLLPAEDGMFDEYFWNENGKWDKIGEVKIDLSDYPTFSQMNAAIDNAVTKKLGGEY